MTTTTDSNFFESAVAMRSCIEKLFEEPNAELLRTLLQSVPKWHENEKIKDNILDSLDNLFAYGYESTRNYEHTQVILTKLREVFKVQKMFNSIEPEYILSCLDRAACKWDSGVDNFVIENDINADAIDMAKLFLTFFIDENDEIKHVLQQTVTKEMREACVFGNWQFYEFLYGFVPLNDMIERCHEECAVMSSCKDREEWLRANWSTPQKRTKKE